MQSRHALILAGHGSHISAETAGLVWRYVDLLRQANIADEITACFWKEQPSFHEVLDTVQADHITIVPVFTAQGYFTQEVIPAEIGLSGEVNRIAERRIHYAKTLGEHPDLARIIRQRVVSALDTLEPSQTTVAIVGHGTRRSTQSQHATREQVDLLAQANLVTTVIDAYLDDDPDIPSIYHRAATTNIIVVPFFLAPGSHVTIDVPEALGLPEGVPSALLNGKNIIYTDPVGTDDAIVQLITDLAHAAGLPERNPPPATSVWSGAPLQGRDALLEAVDRTDELTFGELIITRNAVFPLHPAPAPTVLRTPQALRDHLRENPFRPLASSKDLLRDWLVPVERIEDIPAIVETIYPGALAAWSSARLGQFEAGSLDATIARQCGNFQQLAELSESAIAQTITDVCGNCIKCPAWAKIKTTSRDIPCPEPCNFWMSKALETLS